jgi:hypothetical protein
VALVEREKGKGKREKGEGRREKRRGKERKGSRLLIPISQNRNLEP